MNLFKSRIKPALWTSLTINVLIVGYACWKLRPPKAFDTAHVKYTLNRDKLYEVLKVGPSSIVFIGDSQIQKFELSEFLKQSDLINRGIDGDVTMGVYKRLDDVMSAQPSKLFIEIGINDIRYNISIDTSIKYTEKIIMKTQNKSSKTKIFIIGLLPNSIVNSELVVNYNKRLQQLCSKYDIVFVDSYSKLNINGNLNPAYDCGDGLHLSGNGYLAWSSLLKPYLN